MEYSFRDFMKILAKRWYILLVSFLVLGFGVFFYAEYNYVERYTSSWQLRYMYTATEKPYDPATDDLLDWLYNSNSANSLNYFNSTYLNIQHTEVFQWLEEEVANNYDANVDGYTVTKKYTDTELKGMLSITAYNAASTSSTIAQGFLVSSTSTSQSDSKIILEIYCKLINARIKTLASPGNEEIGYNQNVAIQLIPWDQISYSQTEKTSLRSGIIGALVGLVLAIVIVFLIEIFDTHIHSEKELSDKFGLPILASIPELDNKAVNNRKTDREVSVNVK